MPFFFACRAQDYTFCLLIVWYMLSDKIKDKSALKARTFLNVRDKVHVCYWYWLDGKQCRLPAACSNIKNPSLAIFFWGELIDKYKDINANSKTVFTDYAMLKLVHIVPIYFYYSVNQRWAWLKNSYQLRKLGPSWYLLPYRYKACWKPAKSKREIYVTNIGHCQFVIYIFHVY